ncbi:hypothetical protein K1J50_12480 [Caldovatus sp. SYSU G05006]|uniref:Uncharacterized protein n=1 Tax=Caldovatus aquaticus TaxID=2865671 RepID=A0ABS7F3W0_9PROT|nr:hypothetical protein [Caldovatus aquaticus]
MAPCVGPVLAGILTLAAAGESVAQGAALLFAYAPGSACRSCWPSPS